VHPVLLPRLDFSKGIPSEYRTLVVVPTMLSDANYIEELLKNLEVRYLANTASHVHFGLLTDFFDAYLENMPDDHALEEQAVNGIKDLNKKYSTTDEDIFYLFHRPRKWNKQEKKWMGYERKRGKLSALNALIRNRSNHEFSTIVGNTDLLTNVKYVISLDSDTRLPRDAAWKLIATMAHPLNKAIYSKRKRRVTAGYGILQPRIESGIPNEKPTLYLQMQGQLAGIDPYTRLSSDVYQDLFGEGSFIGKGIYDVDIFEQVLHNEFQENRILSHDLLEGCYCRSGLLSNVVLYDESPAKYEADIRRQHRWIRGDWQIGAWMLPLVSNAAGKLTGNKLSALSRWKILDNLRRSLLPLSLMLLLLAGWFLLPFPWFWTLTVTFIVLLAVMAAAGWQLLNRPDDISLKAHLHDTLILVRDICIRFIFDMSVLPYQAYRYTNAVLIANWRMIFSKKNLLQWTPSAIEIMYAGNELFRTYLNMWIAPVTGIACIIGLGINHGESLLVASPILLLWIMAPALAWKVSTASKNEDNLLSAAQYVFLQHTARKTWTYFERFVTEEDNWLPPDNYQEKPVAVIAHRTSPTNIGLALLANLAAYDFGYITGGKMANRCALSMATMEKLERFKGHFYNWYDTRTLAILRPAYISTVDSGNLIGHLLTLKQGLLALANEKLFSNNLLNGLYNTASILHDVAPKNISQQTEEIKAFLQQAISENICSCSALKEKLDALLVMIALLRPVTTDMQHVANDWVSRLRDDAKSINEELGTKIPWLNLLPAPEKFPALSVLDAFHSPIALIELLSTITNEIRTYHHVGHSAIETERLLLLENLLAPAIIHLKEYILLLNTLAGHCESMSTVSYDFLFNKATSLLSIGYNADEYKVDTGSYDLMASEARLGIFAAIAQGKLPEKSWFVLGRLLTGNEGGPVLLSWSGSMFEYLMPQLIMPVYENTLLHQTGESTVKKQIAYAEQRQVPWGISESGYNALDVSLNYQYRAFGVPGLGLKRGLEGDLVIAPYATMLALMVAPKKACSNLQILSGLGLMGELGFYEAIDYTTARMPRGKESVIIQSYMVHHQGMGLLSLAYLLLDKPMQKRFSAELRFKATMLLLQERIPKTTLFYAHTSDLLQTHAQQDEVHVRRITTPNTLRPEVQLLSNGRYRIMITNAGGGYSRWKDIAINRWREDATKDDRGIFCYIKDVTTGNFWSNTYQPTLHPAKDYEVLFSQGHVEFRRKDFGIETTTEIVVSPEDDAEMRRICITNRNGEEKILEITSYAEVVMAAQDSDEAHQAFSNLFVQTSIVRENCAIFSTRRACSQDELPPWMFHRMDLQNAEVITVSFETDRMKFIGRNRSLIHPHAMDQTELSGSEGSVLDPIMAIRYRIKIKPNKTAIFNLIYGISETKEGSEALMFKYADAHLKKRAFELFWTHNQVLLRQINASEAEAQLYTRLASSLIFSNPAFRANADLIRSNSGSQPGLWSQSVSGDLPIILLHIHNEENIEIVQQLVKAHAYWRLKGLYADLVIWNENPGNYRQQFHERVLGLITGETGVQPSQHKLGSIFVRMVDQLSTEERILFESVAKIILYDDKGSLSEQVNAIFTHQILPALLEPKKNLLLNKNKPLVLPGDLQFYNGTGGFSQDGKEYKIVTHARQTTPAPWVNVIANPHFGTVVSESGAAYTWALNAHEYRITPWTNDPVTDGAGEAFYVRDEDSGAFWSPAPYPAKSNTPYLTTHGFGYSTFEHAEKGIYSHMTVFVDKEFPVKCIILKISNHSGRERSLSATGYMDIILGDLRAKTHMHIVSELDAGNSTLLFKNRYNAVFAERVGFFRMLGTISSFSADRSLFMGRNGRLENPAALYRKKLSGKTGAGFDPCAALQVKFDLLNGEEKEIIFLLGNEATGKRTKELLTTFSDKNVVYQSLSNVKAYWNDILGKVQITTPDKALNILSNGWLTYQTIACRIFARSGFYQSGGAFGFRDQLQDVLALLDSQPQMARNQLLLHASRQFTEGDVQHWWHPPEGRGVRTRCSDDMLWLPFAVARYVAVTGDTEVLNEKISFLESRILHPEEDSFYDLPMKGSLAETLYDHCKRAIHFSIRFGVHGLPLIGAGDWNDGMDRVGNEGKGESVWLGFFLYDVLMKFTDVAALLGDEPFAAICSTEAINLQKSIETSAWDGEWYMRAWFDDGTPLGTRANSECRIDAIAQSWSVLSGAGNVHRQHLAMQSLDTHLVDRKLGLIKLLTPSFDQSSLNPGYIKGYVPGVRENGGQYSHAAIWALMAFAKLGIRQKTWELYNLIQPIGHTKDEKSVNIYKAEPYVMAADVYANTQHEGRGGWTWYTGSAGWMYQFISGSLIGMQRRGNQLHFNPCFPEEWPFVEVRLQHGESVYQIKIYQDAEYRKDWHQMDMEKGNGSTIHMNDDGLLHQVEVHCAINGN
jgi:cellobiose phosphorylase